MTLVGTNFRPGATVVISPPLAAVSDSNGHTRATDVSVVSVVVANPGLMTALFSVKAASFGGRPDQFQHAVGFGIESSRLQHVLGCRTHDLR